MMYNILFIFFVIFGACIGSFLTMIVYRLPNNLDFIFTKSFCPKCKKRLKIKSLIPLFSFIFQKGRCLECREKINIKYFLIELINTISYFIIYYYFGFSYKSIFLAILFSVNLFISIIDFETMEIDRFGIYILFVLMIIYVLSNPIDPLSSFVSAFLYYFVIKLAEFVLLFWKKDLELLGGGDEKLMLICGAFLRLKNLPRFLILTGFFGVITALIWKKIKKTEYFPFGPAILFSLYAIVFYDWLYLKTFFFLKIIK